MAELPPEQQGIQAKCFHPTGTFSEFKKEETELSIPRRFEEQVERFPQRLAIKTKAHELTYEELNRAANRIAHSLMSPHCQNQQPAGYSGLNEGLTPVDRSNGAEHFPRR